MAPSSAQWRPPRKGAYDFLTKPFEAKDLLYRIEKALEVGRLKVEVDRLRHMVKQKYRFDNIIASSAKMQAHPEPGCPDRLNGFHRLPLWRERHRQGVDGKGHSLEQPPFERAVVAINCGAIPEGLLESELFGHVKGAFTSADGTKKGLLQMADGGTLFMDEIAELSPTLAGQAVAGFSGPRVLCGRRGQAGKNRYPPCHCNESRISGKPFRKASSGRIYIIACM